MRRVVMLPVLVLAFVMLFPSAAHALGEGDPSFGGSYGGSDVQVSGTQTSPGTGGGGTSNVSTGSATRLIACSSAGADPGCAAAIASCTHAPLPAPPNIAVIQTRQPDGTWQQTSITCNSRNGLGDTLAVVTAALVRQHAVRLLPPVAVGIAPATGPTLVNMETVFWSPTPQTRQLGPVTILGQPVAITIHFHHTTYDYGDGTTATLTHPGTPWTPDACDTAQCPTLDGHTYTTPATTLTTHATITWTATFTVAGGPTQPIPGTINGPTATHTLQVLQGRAVLVR